MSRSVRCMVLMLATLALLGAGWSIARAATSSVTFTVNWIEDYSDVNLGDGRCDASSAPNDQCTLRAAIEELNALGPGVQPYRIEFDLAGTAPFTIAPNAELPPIDVPILLDGTSQPGASCPTDDLQANLLVVLDGAGAGATADGLVLSYGGNGSTIRGLVIGGFGDEGIAILGDENNIRCNHIGLAADGLTPFGNGGQGILVSGDDNTIGGETAAWQRNVISDNRNSGIYINSSGENNRIGGNFVGTTGDGLGSLGNQSGIYVGGNNNDIGSPNRAGRNVISGNWTYGIRLNASADNVVRGNAVGAAGDGHSPSANGGAGVELRGNAQGNQVGGATAGEANFIAFNGGDGILMQTSIVGVPSGNTLRGNIIMANGALGIDLGGDGVDTNDVGDVDGGENGRQNYPVLQAADEGVVVTGTLKSQASTMYTVDLYASEACDPSGYGEAQVALATLAVTTNASGSATFAFAGSPPSWPEVSFVATATDPAGNTSEFSACLTLVLPAPTPSPTASPTPSPTPAPTPSSTPEAPTPSPLFIPFVSR